jgi:hypothetical protein
MLRVNIVLASTLWADCFGIGERKYALRVHERFFAIQAANLLLTRHGALA